MDFIAEDDGFIFVGQFYCNYIQRDCHLICPFDHNGHHNITINVKYRNIYMGVVGS